jgi:membrane-associated phospholipid phosphatase
MTFFTYPSANYAKSIRYLKIFCKCLFLTFILFVFTDYSFCQSITDESFHIKLKRISQSDEHTKKILLSIRNHNGFRMKSSSYSNTELNQANINGYKTEKPKTLKMNNDGDFVSNSENQSDKNTPQMILANTISVMEYQVSSLFSMDKRDLLYVGAIGGITLGLIAFDARLDQSVTKLKNKSHTIDVTSDFITEFGGSKGVYTVAVFTGLSIIMNSKKGLQTSLYAFEAMLNSGLWVRLGKLFAGRERPSAAYEYSKHPSGIWKGPINQFINKEKRSVASYDAFPSGHTATIFSIATVFAEQYKDIKIVPIISYSFATLVGVSRMLEHTHWASDVFLGACIGYICGKTTIDFYRQKEGYTGKKVKLSLKPSITPQNYGADFVMNF